jgi:hypothetical protein
VGIPDHHPNKFWVKILPMADFIQTKFDQGASGSFGSSCIEVSIGGDNLFQAQLCNGHEPVLGGFG